jgi:galactose mutarotase-like enzyme
MTLELASGTARLVVEPAAGGRARSWLAGGYELLGAADGPAGASPVGWGMYLMAPWPGRLRGNTVGHRGGRHPMPASSGGWALHGTVLDRAWEVEQPAVGHDDGSVSAVLSVRLGDPADAWPWPGRVRATWVLRPGALETTVELSSAGETFPAAAGWHPWFRRRLERGEPVQVELPGDTMLERGADHLPTGRLVRPRPPGPYDDAFPLPGGRLALRWPGVLRLECRTDCRWAVVFDELEPAVCVEPQTGPPDGVNTEPAPVRPGVPLTTRSVWSWWPEL